MKKSSGTSLYFYLHDQLAMVSTKISNRTFSRYGHQPLAELNEQDASREHRFLGSDGQGSVLYRKSTVNSAAYTYSAFGYNPQMLGTPSNLGFTGQFCEHVGLYLLGNGNRAYNPSLMRFHSPDSMSPFCAGGINCYAYCGADPVNRTDPDGHAFRNRSSYSSGTSGLTVTIFPVPEAPHSPPATQRNPPRRSVMPTGRLAARPPMAIPEGVAVSSLPKRRFADYTPPHAQLGRAEPTPLQLKYRMNDSNNPWKALNDAQEARTNPVVVPATQDGGYATFQPVAAEGIPNLPSQRNGIRGSEQTFRGPSLEARRP